MDTNDEVTNLPSQTKNTLNELSQIEEFKNEHVIKFRAPKIE